MTHLERLARTRYEAWRERFDGGGWVDFPPWAELEEKARADLIDIERAVLRELREPSEGMVEAVAVRKPFIGRPEAPESSRDRYAKAVRSAARKDFVRMIDHILDDKTETGNEA